MTLPTLRRYQAATPVSMKQGYSVQLDGLALPTPVGEPLQVPTHALAFAIATEWNAQPRDIKPAMMPLTQLAMTAQDRPAQPQELLGWLTGDLIAHYAEADELRQAEEAAWQPLHDWLQQRFNARLPITIGIVPNRDAADAGTLPGYLAALDCYRLLAVRELASTLNSVTLALALLDGHSDPAAAVAAAEVDSRWQMQRWGDDADLLRRHTALQTEVETLLNFVALLG